MGLLALTGHLFLVFNIILYFRYKSQMIENIGQVEIKRGFLLMAVTFYMRVFLVLFLFTVIILKNIFFKPEAQCPV